MTSFPIQQCGTQLKFTHPFSNSVMHMTSRTPGFMTLSEENFSRFQVAILMMAWLSRWNTSDDFVVRHDFCESGPPICIRSASVLPSWLFCNERGRLNIAESVRTEFDKCPFVFAHSVLCVRLYCSTSRTRYGRIALRTPALIPFTLIRSSSRWNGPLRSRYMTMFSASACDTPGTRINWKTLSTFTLMNTVAPPSRDWLCFDDRLTLSCMEKSLRLLSGDPPAPPVGRRTQISSRIFINFVAPTPETRARSSTFLNMPIWRRCSTMLRAVSRLMPGSVINSSSVALLTSSWLAEHDTFGAVPSSLTWKTALRLRWWRPFVFGVLVWFSWHMFGLS